MLLAVKKARTLGRLQAAFTLPEVALAIGIAGIVAVSLGTTLIYSAKSIAALNNYVAMDRGGRATVDQMIQDIRGCREVTSISPSGTYTNLSSITAVNQDSNVLTYTFTGSNTLVRVANGTSDTLLTNCVGHFELYQPILKSGSWNQYNNPASLRDCKVVLVRWTTTRTVVGRAANTEDIVTAKILMRN